MKKRFWTILTVVTILLGIWVAHIINMNYIELFPKESYEISDSTQVHMPDMATITLYWSLKYSTNDVLPKRNRLELEEHLNVHTDFCMEIYALQPDSFLNDIKKYLFENDLFNPYFYTCINGTNYTNVTFHNCNAAGIVITPGPRKARIINETDDYYTVIDMSGGILKVFKMTTKN